MLIRRETPADRAAIHAVHSEAFRREESVTPVEAPLVDGAAVGLGPLGVLLTHQPSGVGSALVHAVVGAADLSITAYDPTQAGAFEYAPAFSRI